MRVVLDGATVSQPDSGSRGFGRYVDALLSSLAGISDIQLVALMQGPEPVAPHVERIDVRRRRLNPRLDWYEDILSIGRDAHRARADVFHSPSVDPPFHYGGPWVQTLHDAIPLVFPSALWGRERFRWKVRARLMKRADAVICISRHTADIAVSTLGIDHRRTHVIYHGVTPVFREVVEPAATTEPYLLYVGAFSPNKGYQEAFDVIAAVAAAGFAHRLKVVGVVNETNRDRVQAMVEAAPRPDRIELCTAVDDVELVRLYRGADLLAVTSRYEGFGRPTIEAFAAGCPVVSFDNSSLPEVVGDAGILVPDGDVATFAKEVVALLKDDGARRDLGRRSLEASARFDWGRCAEEHAEVYRTVL